MVRLPIRPGQVDLQDQKGDGDRAPRRLEEAVKCDAVDDEWREQGKGERQFSLGAPIRA